MTIIIECFLHFLKSTAKGLTRCRTDSLYRIDLIKNIRTDMIIQVYKFLSNALYVDGIENFRQLILKNLKSTI